MDYKNKDFFLQTGEFEIKEHEDNSDTLKIEGFANCTTKDRAGDIIIEDAWKGDAMVDYLKNPIILAHHDHTKPIGVMTGHEISSKGLRITAEISKAAGATFDLISDGILKAFSVGFRIKDADYDSASDIFLIKDVLLHEVSVVSVPCNQDSIFEVSKNFETSEESAEFKKQFIAKQTSQVTEKVEPKEPIVPKQKEPKEPVDTKNTEDIYSMDPKDLQALIAEELKKASVTAKDEEIRVAAALKEKEAEDARLVQLAATGAEALLGDLKEEMATGKVEFAKAIAELQTTIAEKADEIVELQSAAKNKMQFSDRGIVVASEQEALNEIAEKAFLISKLTNRGIYESKVGQDLQKAANASSSTVVSSDTFYETVVSTNLERDIQELLVLQPLFREVVMTSANMILPINPNATTANWVATAQVSGGSRDATTSGAEITKTLTEITLKTYKLAGKSFLTDETDEDAILPLLPLIRDGLVEAHVLELENTFLKGVNAGDNFDGLITLAASDGTDVTTTATHTGTVKVTSKMILAARRAMGLWGFNVNDLNLIVSLEAYWDLLEDDNFANLNEVGLQATKLTGRVGTLYGLPVLVSTQFATAAASTAYAVIVNSKNFLVPRLRGFTVQSDYQTEEQRRVLVATQRLGFERIIDAQGVATLLYSA